MTQDLKPPPPPPLSLLPLSHRPLPHALSRGHTLRTPGNMLRAGDQERQGQGGIISLKACQVLFQSLLESV